MLAKYQQPGSSPLRGHRETTLKVLWCTVKGKTGEISKKPVPKEISPPQTTKCAAGAIVEKKAIIILFLSFFIL